MPATPATDGFLECGSEAAFTAAVRSSAAGHGRILIAIMRPCG
jgi:hypothetical protein